MENHGALVGWTHQDLGNRVLLCVESVRTPEDAKNHSPDVTRVLMTKKQAAVLGDFLLGLSGESRPDRGDRGMLKRLFG